MHVFEVLGIVVTLDRAGVDCTAHTVAQSLQLSVYLSRKLLHSLHETGLVTWATKEHRPNVLKRLYTPTRRGQHVHYAYKGDLLAIWEGA